MRKKPPVLTAQAPFGQARQPLSALRWVACSKLKANNYNPNKVFPPEMALLKISILENGWTQPVVITPQLAIIALEANTVS